MLRLAAFASASVIVLVLAAPERATASQVAELRVVEVSAQSRDPRVRKRPRARIRVTPVYPRTPYVTFHPLPTGVAYPGPNAVRHCTFRLVPEPRPSGTVIAPRQHCWWARR